jgi:hypothetical protein
VPVASSVVVLGRPLHVWDHPLAPALVGKVTVATVLVVVVVLGAGPEGELALTHVGPCLKYRSSVSALPSLKLTSETPASFGFSCTSSVTVNEKSFLFPCQSFVRFVWYA